MPKYPHTYIHHPEKWNAYQKKKARARRADPLYRLFANTRAGAQRRHEPWLLTLADIKIPAFCPRSGRTIVQGLPSCHALSPLLIRKDPAAGWTPGNVEVVARRTIYPSALGCYSPSKKAPSLPLVGVGEMRPAQALRALEAAATKARMAVWAEKIKLLKDARPRKPRGRPRKTPA